MNRIRLEGGLGLIKRIAPSKADKEIKSENSFASNPFGISFKGKILQADMFEQTVKPSIKENIAQKGKMVASAVVGSLTEFKSAAAQKFEPVMEFGRQIKSHTNEIINKINKFELTQFKVPAISRAKESTDSREVEKLKLKPTSELEEMLSEQIAQLAV